MQFGQLDFPAWLTEYLTNYLRATVRWFFPVTVRRQMARYGHDDLADVRLNNRNLASDMVFAVWQGSCTPLQRERNRRAQDYYLH